jgi:long-chain acyl-CoA synthetase
MLVAKKIREKLGGRLRVIICGGAPLSASVVQTFIGLGLPISQGYGLTETSPIISVNRMEANRPTSVGPPLPGVEINIGPNEELLVRGDLVMSGYWRNKEATNQSIDQDGWLHTGDTARLEHGHLYITGRLKDILVMATGEKVAPTDMEMAVTKDPLFEQAMVIGEGRSYLSMLAVLNQEQYTLLSEQLGLQGTEEHLATETVQEAVLKKIEDHLQSFPVWAKVRRVSLYLDPWTVEQGLITPTLKLRRNCILKHFSADVEEMYKGH